MEEFITVKINYEPKEVKVSDYVTAKTKDLREFGYDKLTESEVLDSVKRVLSGKKKLLGVIDYFVKSDIVILKEKS